MGTKETLADTMSLSEYTDADLPDILALDAQLFPKADIWDEQDYRESIAGHPTKIRVLRDRGTLVGYVYSSVYEVGMPDGSERLVGEIASIAVAKTYAGRGLGGMLLEAGIDDLRSLEAPSVMIHTRIDNYPMQRLALGHGFSETGRIPGYYADGVGAVQMFLTE